MHFKGVISFVFSSWIINEFEERAVNEIPGVSPRGLYRESKMYKRAKCILVNLTITPGKKYRQEKVIKCPRCCIPRRGENRSAKPNVTKETKRNANSIFKRLDFAWHFGCQSILRTKYVHLWTDVYLRLWCALCDMFCTRVRSCQTFGRTYQMYVSLLLIATRRDLEDNTYL